MINIKKKMSIALAGIILAGSMGWSQLPARAATNGEIICSHSNTDTRWFIIGYQSDYWGHMEVHHGEIVCLDEDEKQIGVIVVYGDYETHDYTEWDMIEDRGDGLYRFQIWCGICGYEDETLSDDPNDPKM